MSNGNPIGIIVALIVFVLIFLVIAYAVKRDNEYYYPY